MAAIVNKVYSPGGEIVVSIRGVQKTMRLPGIEVDHKRVLNITLKGSVENPNKVYQVLLIH